MHGLTRKTAQTLVDAIKTHATPKAERKQEAAPIASETQGAPPRSQSLFQPHSEPKTQDATFKQALERLAEKASKSEKDWDLSSKLRHVPVVNSPAELKLGELDKTLATSQTKFLALHSTVIESKDGDVRVFLPTAPPVECDVDASYYSSINMLRGALFLHGFHTDAQAQENQKKRNEKKLIFQRKMAKVLNKHKHIMCDFNRNYDQQYTALEILKETNPNKSPKAIAALEAKLIELVEEANKACKVFNGVIAHELAQAGVPEPDKAMRLMRDYVYKKTFHKQAVCTVVPHSKGYSVRHDRPITLDKQKSPWQQYKVKSEDQPKWAAKLRKRYGMKKQEKGWLDCFVETERDTLAALPRTSMAVDIPGPGNAYDSTQFNVDNEDKVTQTVNSIITSTTEPFKTASSARAELTYQTHKVLFGTENRIKGIVRHAVDRWGITSLDSEMSDDTPVTLPIFDQNLISDGFLYYAQDAKKSRTILSNKKAANKRLQAKLDGMPVWINKTNPDDIRVGGGQPDKSDGEFIKARFEIVESNQCINMWYMFSRTSNEGADRLLELSAQKINAGLGSLIKTSQADHTTAVCQYLNSSNTGLSRGPGKKTKIAIQELKKILLNPTIEMKGSNGKDIDMYVRKNYALLLEQSVKLKQARYEHMPDYVLTRVFRTLLDTLCLTAIFSDTKHFWHYAAVTILWLGLLGAAIAATVIAMPAMMVMMGWGAFVTMTGLKVSYNMPMVAGLMLASGIVMMAAPGQLMAGFTVLAAALSNPVTALIVAAIAITAIVGVAAYAAYRICKWASQPRQSLTQAVHEASVGNLLGVSVPKCMSSCDRGQEQALQQRKVLAEFSERTSAAIAGGGEAKKADQATTAEKHNFLLMATGCPAAKDDETRGYALEMSGNGLFSSAESSLERGLNGATKGQRLGKIPKARKRMSVDEYIRADHALTPAQSEYPKYDI